MSKFYVTDSNNWKSKLLKFWRYSWGKTPAQRLLRYYLLIVLIGSCLLITPLAVKSYVIINDVNAFANQKFKHWNFGLALFLSLSAFSDTGLTISNLSEQFTVFGQVIVLILIQIGGLGYTALKVILLFIIGRKFGLQEKIEVDFERGNQKIGSSIRLIKFVIIFIFSLEIFATLVNALFLFLSPSIAGNSTLNDDNNLGEKLHTNFGISLWYSMFLSISSVNNAGLYLFTIKEFSVIISNYYIEFMVIILTIIGGLGFPVFYDLYLKIKNKIFKDHTRPKYIFKLFTKVAIISYFSILLVGLFALSMSELAANKNATFMINWDSFNKRPHLVHHLFYNSHYNGFQKFMITLFTVASARSTGFAIINLQQFTDPSKVLISILMFIGSSPCSASGGIRSTTIFIVIIFLFFSFLNQKTPHVFRKKISSDLIKRAYRVFFVSIVWITITTLIVDSSIPYSHAAGYRYSIIDALFEACSAFGTTGYTTGVTNFLNVGAFIFISISMFIGQLTVSATLLGFAKQVNYKNLVNYPAEDVNIG